MCSCLPAQCPYQAVTNHMNNGEISKKAKEIFNFLENKKLPLGSKRPTSIYFSLLFPLIWISHLCVLLSFELAILKMEWVCWWRLVTRFIYFLLYSFIYCYRRSYYGGNWASFSFSGLLSWIMEYQVNFLYKFLIY